MIIIHKCSKNEIEKSGLQPLVSFLINILMKGMNIKVPTVHPNF